MFLQGVFGINFFVQFKKISDRSCLYFMLSVFFRKASTAVGTVAVLHVLSLEFWNTLTSVYDVMSRSSKFALSIMSPLFSQAQTWCTILDAEGREFGANYDNGWFRLFGETSVSIHDIWIIQLVTIGIYMVLTLYFELVFPGEYGANLPWYFPFTSSFWMGVRIDQEPNEKSEIMNPKCFEPIPKNTNISISTKNLHKVFTTLAGDKTAVNNLNLDICKNQITSFLGHNGAGKTTTINMLVGMLSPTSGTATIDGYDIKQDTKNARSSVGLCPQFDILFPTLTIREHLYFFAALKGGHTSTFELEMEINDIIEIFNFAKYLDAYPTELSGGWKRRLSCCLALVGKSNFIILDEPTSGMDPSTRRILWTALKEVKKNRTILLSTHFMDEADILGDRVVIISDGNLRAAGSPSFLKDYYGCGYHIVFSKESDEFTQEEIQRILSFVQNTIPKARLETQAGQDLNIVVPFEDVDKFPTLFDLLDEHKNSLSIESYGVMKTSMEEVFFKCTEESRHVYDKRSVVWEDNKFPGLEHPKSTGFKRFMESLFASVRKNCITSLRDKAMIPTMFILTLLLFSMQIFRQNQALGKRKSFTETSPSLELSATPLTIDFKTQKFPFITSPTTRTTDNSSLFSAFQDEINSEQCSDCSFSAAKHESLSSFDIDADLLVAINADGNYINDQTRFVGLGHTFSMGGATEQLYAIFNGQHFHTVAQSLGLLWNTLYRQYSGTNGKITTYNHPLKLNSSEIMYAVDATSFSDLTNDPRGYSHSLLMVGTILCALSLKDKVTEKAVKSKHLQQLTGMWALAYWIGFYVIDFIRIAIVIIPSSYLFLYANDAYFGYSLWANSALMLYMALLIWSILPLTYILSLPFTVPASAIFFVVMVIYFWGTLWSMGMDSYITRNIINVDQIAQRDKLDAYKKWSDPSYTFLDTINRHIRNNDSVTLCNQNEGYRLLCQSEGIKLDKSYWYSTEGDNIKIADNMFILFCQGGVLFLLLILIEMVDVRINYEAINRWLTPRAVRVIFSQKMADELGYDLKLIKDEDMIPEEERKKSIFITGKNLLKDLDVVEEEERVLDEETYPPVVEQDALVTKNLGKIFQTRRGDLNAVKDLSFGVKKETCFGLLGVNGAGKTTTFRMLTGDESITEGEAWLAGYSLVRQKAKAQMNVGYETF